MFTIDIKRMVPHFILNDRNGYAMAKAIEAGLMRMNKIISDGLKQITDTDAMEEWRLDELAWEYNIPYDYTADVEVKRRWIKKAYDLNHMWGTAQGITEYMMEYFDDAALIEGNDYNGQPFHFKMEYPGGWTQERIDWATNAINMVKNVRSTLDKYRFIQEWQQKLSVGLGFYGAESGTYRISREDVPELDYYADEYGDMLLDELGFPLIVEG